METLILFAPLALVFYFFLLRPQQKAKQREEQLHASLEVGDEIVTKSGLYGMITEFDGPTLFMEIADGVEIKVTREAVATMVNYDDESDDVTDDEDGS